MPVALAARDAILTALRAPVDAVDAYTAEVSYQTPLLRPVLELDGRDVSDLAGALPFRVTEIRRALDEGAGISLLLPQRRKRVPPLSLDRPPPGFEALAPSGNASARFILDNHSVS